MKTVIGNIVNYINADTVVPHIVNILGAAASGVVIPIFNKVPEGRTEYEDLCQRYMGDSESLLGITQFIDGVNGNIANMFAQTLGGQRPLFYNHLSTCMDDVAKYCIEMDKTIVAPKFGTMRANGRWDIILELIEDCWIRKDIDVTIVEWESN